MENPSLLHFRIMSKTFDIGRDNTSSPGSAQFLVVQTPTLRGSSDSRSSYDVEKRLYFDVVDECPDGGLKAWLVVFGVRRYLDIHRAQGLTVSFLRLHVAVVLLSVSSTPGVYVDALKYMNRDRRLTNDAQIFQAFYETYTLRDQTPSAMYAPSYLLFSYDG